MRILFTSRSRTDKPDMAAVLSDLAAAIEASAPAQCGHNVRKSCPLCQARQQALADARRVRAAGEVAS